MRPSEKRVGIIGAGASGLAAAWRLSRHGVPATVFEKSRGFSGRAATRRRGELCYDHGANFFRLDDPRVADLLQQQLPAEDLVEIPGDVHAFGTDDVIRPGDPAHNSVPKWTYRRGINTLGKLLAAGSAHADVRRQTRIATLVESDGRWFLHDDTGTSHGPFHAILITAPAPQAAELLRHSGIDAAPLAALHYHLQFSFILGYDHTVQPDRDFHALVNTDGRHPLAWLSFEDDKPGHVPAGASVLVAQMSPDWSAARRDEPPETLLDEVVAHADALLPHAAGPPSWWDSQRWRYAHPAGRLDRAALAPLETRGIHLAGDALAGAGRVAKALATGLDAADRLHAVLG